MFGDPCLLLQRTRGRAEVALSLRDGATRLDRLAQAGSAKAFLPRTNSADPEVVFLNTAGGLTGGDQLRYALSVGDGASVAAATQTAERLYRATSGVADVSVTLTVGSGATLHWLPQETIVFDGAALDRKTTVNLAAGARFLMTETIVLGRAAMGEQVKTLDLTDARIITRGGRPLMVEPLHLNTETLKRRRPAALGTARALTTIVYVADDAEDALGPVRTMLSTCHSAASAWDGRLVVRAMAADAFALRKLVARVLTILRGKPLPRVWQV